MNNIITGAVSLGLLWSIMALGVFITYRILDYPDLTVEGSIATGAAIAAKMISQGLNPITATMVAVIGGIIAGMCTGVLHTKLKIPGILAGILSMIALYSINIRIMGKANITLLKSKTIFDLFSVVNMKKTTIIIIVGVAIVSAVVLLTYLFFNTEIGMALRATGSNEKMATSMGINTHTMKIIGLAISNGLVALSGALIAQNQSFADIQMGQGAIVIGLASVIIGEVLFYRNGIINHLVAVVLGAITYRVIIALVIEMGMQPTDLKLFTAITVAICLFLPSIKNKIMVNLLSKKSKVSSKSKIAKEISKGKVAL